MTTTISALLIPFVLVGVLIVLDKLCSVIAAEARRARMRARTRRSLRERARRSRAIQMKNIRRHNDGIF